MPSSLNLPGFFADAVAEHLSIVQHLHAQEEQFERAAMRITDCLLQGHKVLWCGNGGSAAQAQHMAAELVGRVRRNRQPFPSIALTTDSAVLTAIANDWNFEEVFERQVVALCEPADVLVGLSTSGNSANVCRALSKAHEIGAFTVAFTGRKGGRAAALADVCLRIDSIDAARIQEGHLLCGHILCEWVELVRCIAHVVENPASQPGVMQ